MKIVSAMREALLKRAEDARSRARAVAPDAVARFEAALLGSQATVSVSAEFSFGFFGADRPLYSTYGKLVRSEVRSPAKPADDRLRVVAEGALYGSEASEVCYGALSTQGAGLRSYGDLALRLREVAVESRATVLEENSYAFAQRAPAGTSALPEGFVGCWQDRAEVAIAKHAEELSDDCSDEQFEKIILSSDGDRKSDRFLEVHIWGTFNVEAVDSVRELTAPDPNDEDAGQLRKLVQNLASRHGLGWLSL